MKLNEITPERSLPKEKLVLTNESTEKNPIIRSIQYNPAVIYIQFPGGDIWEYVLYDNWKLKNLLKSYRRNVGRLVANLKKMNVEARKLE